MSLGIFWAGLKDVVWGLVSLSALTKGSVWNAIPLQMGSQTTMSCAQAENSGLLGPLQSPNWFKVCLISTVVFLPVSIVPRVEKCLGLSVGDRVLCLRFYQTESRDNRLSVLPVTSPYKEDCWPDLLLCSWWCTTGVCTLLVFFRSLFFDRLVGLVVRRSPRERKIPGSNPACAGIFSGSSHTSDLKIGTPVACQTPGVIGSALGLVSPVSVYCDWVR